MIINVSVTSDVLETMFEHKKVIEPYKVVDGIPLGSVLKNVIFNNGVFTLIYEVPNTTHINIRIDKTVTCQSLPAQCSPPQEDYEKSFQTYWKNLVCNDDGSLNEDQIKRELHDYLFMLNEVPKVYSEVSGGMLSYPNYYANTVIGEFNNFVDNLCEDAVEDELEYLKDQTFYVKSKEGISVKEFKEQLTTLIQNLQGKNPGVEEWKQIKSMLDNLEEYTEEQLIEL